MGNKKTARDYAKGLVKWALGNTAWDYIKRIGLVLFTWFFTHRTLVIPEVSGFLNTMHISIIVAVVTMLLGFGLVAWYVITFILWVIKRAFKTPQRVARSYGAVDLVQFEYPWAPHQLNLGAVSYRNFLKVGLRIINRGDKKIRCGLRMMSLDYNGLGVVWGWNSNEQWIESQTPVEKNFLKWDEGYDAIEGKIDISPLGGIGNILFVEANQQGADFWFWYVHGKSRNDQTLDGAYKANCQLEGDYEMDGIKLVLERIRYAIEFTYRHRKLENFVIRRVSV